MFKSARALILPIAGVVAAAVPTFRSDPIAVYAVIDKVVLAPATNPSTIEIWGQFTISENKGGDHYKPAVKGYLYLSMDPAKERAIRAEWADLQSLAGKGGIVGFGAKYSKSTLRIRCMSEKPANPDVYTTNIGVQKDVHQYNTAGADLKTNLKKPAPAAACESK